RRLACCRAGHPARRKRHDMLLPDSTVQGRAAGRRPLRQATRLTLPCGSGRYAAVCLLSCLVLRLAVADVLPQIGIAKGGRTFVTDHGKPFVPMGVTYYRPGTGWAPQVWKQFDEEATRKDLTLMKGLGVNCARIFLSFGSFYQTPGKLEQEGLQKFD